MVALGSRPPTGGEYWPEALENVPSLGKVSFKIFSFTFYFKPGFGTFWSASQISFGWVALGYSRGKPKPYVSIQHWTENFSVPIFKNFGIKFRKCWNCLKFSIFFKFSTLAWSTSCSRSELVTVAVAGDLAKLFRTMTEFFLPTKWTAAGTDIIKKLTCGLLYLTTWMFN